MIVGWVLAGGLLLVSGWLALRNRRLADRLAAGDSHATEAVEQRDALRAVIDALPDLVLYKSADGAYLGGNRTAAALLGPPDDATAAASAADLLPAELARHLTALDREALRTGRSVTGQHWSSRDGTPVLLLSTHSPFIDRSGTILGVTVVARDVTRDSSNAEKLRLVWDRSPNFLTIATPSTGAVEVNPATLRLLGTENRRPDNVADLSPLLQPNGQSSAALLNEFFEFAVHLLKAEGEPPPLPAYPTFRIECNSFRYEWALKRDGEEPLITEAVATPLDVAGECFVFTSFRDITDRKEAQVAVRAAKELAEAAARTKSNFFANLSHEIRTPMNAIIGLSTLVLKTGLTAHQRGYLGKIQQAAQMLLEMVNDILDFSKLEAGKLTFERTEFDPDEILDRVGNLIGGRAAAKGLELIFNIDPRLNFTLAGDPLRLSQIFVNYIANAVKFTEFGEVELIIEVIEETASDVSLYCAVRDTGIGLSGEQMSRLFQPFEQADTSITRRYGGTGLGLVICKNLAEAMGGGVGVDSVEGAGSTFWFTVRLGKGEGGIAEAPDMALRDLPILVVDDHPRTREVVGNMLRGMGFVVETAASGTAAVAAMGAAASGRAPFALILLDSEMTDLDGFATAAAINALGVEPAPRIILMIGAWGEEVTDDARQVGVEYMLPKPVTPSLLLNIIAHALHDPEGMSSTTSAIEESGGPSAPAAWRGRRILLVDDNELNQEIAVGLLGLLGFEVELATDGAIAVEKILGRDADYYAAVLMDMQMPVMDGLTATRAIRRSASHGALPIIAMTANDLIEDRNRCLAAGMNDHLAKPVEPELLRATLAHWLGGDAIETAAAVPVCAPELPAIGGVDTVAGLRRMMGNAANYVAVLRKFAERQEVAAREIGQALQAADRETAERVAHTLKGVAAGVGADGIAEQARRIEAAIRTGAGVRDIDADLAGLGEALDALVAELRRALPQPPVALAAGPPDRERAEHASRRLAALLADSDTAALAFLSENSNVLRNTLGEHFREIETATQGFDFATALGALKRAAGDLEIAL